MTNTTRASAGLASLPTPVIADALVRLGRPARQAPLGIAGPAGVSIAGRVLPVRHFGSVDVFLEALQEGQAGDVMVVDNGGRQDEACIGDLIAHEAQAAGVAGIVIWGAHRDVDEIEALGMPVFSYGTLPFGPIHTRPAAEDRFESAGFGDTTVTRSDIVVADGNGVLFVDHGDVDEVVPIATDIRDTEIRQNELLAAGTSLREQFDFAAYLRDRQRDPQRTFRQHLRERGRSIEE